MFRGSEIPKHDTNVIYLQEKKLSIIMDNNVNDINGLYHKIMSICMSTIKN